MMKISSRYAIFLLVCSVCLYFAGDLSVFVQPQFAYAQALATAMPTALADQLATQPAEPLPLSEARPPVRLAIPALDFAVAVTPMAWQVTEVAGQRQAVWQVPEASAGWHVNSAGVGAAGNVLLSGHHRLGAAVFAALARGEVEVGQQLLLMDDQGQTFVYTITTIADPIPALGATADEPARDAPYLEIGTQPQLTLLTGWPEFSDSHTLIIVAQLSGRLAPPGVVTATVGATTPTKQPSTPTASPTVGATKTVTPTTRAGQVATVKSTSTITTSSPISPTRIVTPTVQATALVATATAVPPTATQPPSTPTTMTTARATATATPDLTATANTIQAWVEATLTALPSPTAQATPAPPSPTPDLLATEVALQRAVVATLTALAPTLPMTPTQTPDLVATAVLVQEGVEATQTAQAPSPSPTQTPDLVATAVVVEQGVAATLIPLTPTQTPTPTPNVVATAFVVQQALAATLTAQAPPPTPTTTATPTPNLVATAVVVEQGLQATLTALAPTATPTPTLTPFVVTATPTPVDVFAAATLVIRMTAEAQSIGTATPTPLNMIVAATNTPPPTTTDTLSARPIVVTATPTPGDVFAAATAVMQMTVEALTTGTAIPTPPNMLVVTTTFAISTTARPESNGSSTPLSLLPTMIPTATQFAVIATATPADAAAAATLAARVTQEAQSTGTATPPPPNLVVVTVTPAEHAGPAAKVTATRRAVAPVTAPATLAGKILFLADADGQAGPEAYAINPDGTQLTQLANLDAYNRAVARQGFSSDMLRHAFSRRETNGEQAIQIFYEDNPGRFTKQVTFLGGVSAWAPAWSPRQEVIAFVVTYAHNDEIWLTYQQADQWLTKTLTPNQWHHDRHPSWSPTGEQIVFGSDRAGKRRQIWLMNADGSKLRQLTDLAFEAWDPVWVK